MFVALQVLAQVLKQNTTIRSLDFQGNGIKQEGAKARRSLLCQIKHLTMCFLDVEVQMSCRQALAEALKQNFRLTSINLHGNRLGDEGAKAGWRSKLPSPLSPFLAVRPWQRQYSNTSQSQPSTSAAIEWATKGPRQSCSISPECSAASCAVGVPGPSRGR